MNEACRVCGFNKKPLHVNRVCPDCSADLNDRVKVADSMIRYGGGFVNALGQALIRADTDNTQRIALAFPEYWAKYLAISKEKEE